jgi:hypothetical protein
MVGDAMVDSESKSTALVRFVEGLDESNGLRGKASHVLEGANKAMVAFVRSVDGAGEALGQRARRGVYRRVAKLRRSMTKRARGFLRETIDDALDARNVPGPRFADPEAPVEPSPVDQMRNFTERLERMNSELARRQPGGAPDAYVPTGELDVTTVDEVIAPGATMTLTVGLPRANFFWPAGVRARVVRAADSQTPLCLDVTGVEINARAQVSDMVPTNFWADVPPGCAVPVRWGLFATQYFCECMTITVVNPTAFAARLVLNIYGVELNAVPPGVMLGQPFDKPVKPAEMRRAGCARRY